MKKMPQISFEEKILFNYYIYKSDDINDPEVFPSLDYKTDMNDLMNDSFTNEFTEYMTKRYGQLSKGYTKDLVREDTLRQEYSLEVTSDSIKVWLRLLDFQLSV